MSARLGIVGGGQLGAYLCAAAKDNGIQTAVLTKNPEGLILDYADQIIDASFDDLDAVRQLLHASDVVTFELEDVPVSTLDLLEAQTDVEVYPRPETMRLLQNKALQKNWLSNHEFPTSAHIVFDDGLDAARAISALGPDFVIKTQRGGYDGLGVKVVRNGVVPDGYATVPTIAEALVNDFEEVAVLVARTADESMMCFPVFQSNFDDGGNVVRRVFCPASISQDDEELALELARKVIDTMDGVGLFAVEFFLTADGLLVNEIAPRVHNVGHMTMESASVSQFEQHVRAVAGLGLAPLAPPSPAVMDNLLYEESIAKACHEQITLDDVAVHWYGKSAPRPLRKMGHLTAVGQTLQEAVALADNALIKLQQRD